MRPSLRKQFLIPFLIAMAGFGLGSVTDLTALPNHAMYEPFTYVLLAVGLYGSVYGIDLNELRTHRGIVLQAVTIGVFLKAVIIGGVFYLLSNKPTAFLLGLTVAQIDPLSVANLFHSQTSKISERAKTILSAWASFDDPMTVLLSVYALYFFIPHPAASESQGILFGFISGLLQNLSFAGLVFLLVRLLGRIQTPAFQWGLLLVSFVIGVTFQWMLGIALIGLFLRPQFKWLPQLISLSFYLALFLIGTILAGGVGWIGGLMLAVGALVAQIVVGLLLTNRLPWHERLFLAFAQQNGITAIILALLLEKNMSGAVGIIGPAILFINVGYYFSNRLLYIVLYKKGKE